MIEKEKLKDKNYRQQSSTAERISQIQDVMVPNGGVTNTWVWSISRTKPLVMR